MKTKERRLSRGYIFDIQPKQYSNAYILLICFLTALTVITFCTEAIYDFIGNDDVHCFFTVGNSILHGYVPYRDIYEQKGPVLYMFFAVCAFISDTSFIGMYIFEIICGTVFLYFGYKTIQLFRDISVLWILILGVVVYSSRALCSGGECEEFMLPLLMYAVYIVTKSIKKDEPISYRSAFFIGITSALIFWTKYTVISFYIGLAIAFVILRAKKDGQKIFFDMLFLIGGVLVVSIPVIYYFIANNAINDLYIAYFLNNMTLYSRGNIFYNYGQAISSISVSNTATFISIVLAIMYYIRERKEKINRQMLLLVSCTALAFFFISFFGGRYYYYYTIPLSALAPFGLIAARDYTMLIANKLKNASLPMCLKPICACAFCVICLLYAYPFNSDSYYRTHNKDELIQFQFAEIINQEENPTLLCYNFMDYGFYTASGVMPCTKYFSWLNVRYDEIMDTQNEVIENGEAEFVIAYDEQLKTSKYELVDEVYFEPRDSIYRLYKLIDE